MQALELSCLCSVLDCCNNSYPAFHFGRLTLSKLFPRYSTGAHCRLSAQLKCIQVDGEGAKRLSQKGHNQAVTAGDKRGGPGVIFFSIAEIAFFYFTFPIPALL